MASTSFSATFNGSAKAVLVASGQRFPKFYFSVIGNVGADVILAVARSVTLMKLPGSVIFETGGSRDAIFYQQQAQLNCKVHVC